AVFVPVAFIPGITGKMFQQFAVTIAVSVGISTVMALTLAPALCAIFLRSKEDLPKRSYYEKYRELYNDYWADKQQLEGFEKLKAWGEFLAYGWDVSLKKFDRAFDRTKKTYLNSSASFIKNSVKTIGVYILLFLALVFIKAALIPDGFLPTEDSGAVFVNVQLKEGTSLAKTNETIEHLVNDCLKVPGVHSVLSLNGFNGQNTAILICHLEEWQKRLKPNFIKYLFMSKEKKLKAKKELNDIIANLNATARNYPNARINAGVPPAIRGLSMFDGVEYQMLDKGQRTPQELFTEAQKFMVKIAQNPKFNYAFTQYNANTPQLVIKIDFEKVLAQGINISDVYTALSSQFGTYYVNDFNLYGRVFRVMMSADEQYRNSLASIDKVYVKTAFGTSAPLSSLITIEPATGPYDITRFNMYKSIQIIATQAKGQSTGNAIKEMERMSKEYLPEDIGFAWSGTSLQEIESQGATGPIIIMCVIFVYLFLVALYESWMLPIGVMLIVPIAALGAIIFQYVWGNSFDIYANIGLIMLMGLSAKQAILIIEFAKTEREAGLGIADAAMKAADIRFRAVIMTVLAFILGILPLVFAHGPGSMSRNSLGVTVFGGMTAAAVVGTIMVPAFYVICQALRENTAKKWHNGSKRIEKDNEQKN
ncbi:efflux RND transporter permease subunit, partial [bacterium]|nr:efflux RND transporter permease subunit [bacterium]